MGGKVTGLTKALPKGAIALVRKMASSGASQEVMASALGASAKTLRAWLEQYPELQTALVEAREKERTRLHGSLYVRAMDPKNSQGAASAMFLLKARHNYRENAIEDTGARLNIVFNMPGALPLDEYVKVAKEFNGTRAIEG